MATGKLIGEVLKPLPPPHAIANIANDAQSKRIAANAGEEFTKEIGGSIDLAGGSGANDLHMVALPDHLGSREGARGCCGHGVEIGDGEAEARISLNRKAERGHRVGRVDGLRRFAVEGGGLWVCRDVPTVVLDRRPGVARLASPT